MIKNIGILPDNNVYSGVLKEQASLMRDILKKSTEKGDQGIVGIIAGANVGRLVTPTTETDYMYASKEKLKSEIKKLNPRKVYVMWINNKEIMDCSLEEFPYGLMDKKA